MKVRLAITGLVTLLSGCLTPAIADRPPNDMPVIPKVCKAAPEVVDPNVKAALESGKAAKITITREDEGYVRVKEGGSAEGAGATASGDKLRDDMTGTPSTVTLSGGATAEGGGINRKSKGSAFLPPASLMSNPLLWVGIVLGLAGGACFYFRLPMRLAGSLVAAGLACAAGAFYPILLPVGACVALAVIAGPSIWAEIKNRTALKAATEDAHGKTEALRAVVEGVEHASVPIEAQAAVKNAIARAADAADKLVIDGIKRMDKVGKYAE